MTKDFLIDGISNIDEDLIARFIVIDEALNGLQSRKRKGIRTQTKVIAAAACLALAVGIGFAAVPVMKLMGIIGGESVTTEFVTDETPAQSLVSVVMEDERIDLNSDGISDKILIKTNGSGEKAPSEVMVAVADGKTGEEIWSESIPISDSERYACYFSNFEGGEDKIILWSYSTPDGGKTLTYKSRMINFKENNEQNVVADTEYTFNFEDRKEPYENEDEYWSMLLLNLNKNLSGADIKGYLIVDNTGDELEIWSGESLRRKSDIRYTLADIIKRVSK